MQRWRQQRLGEERGSGAGAALPARSAPSAPADARGRHGRARRTCASATREQAAQAGARHPGKGYGLVRRQGRQDVHRVFELVNANQASVPVHTMCRVLKVSASGHYAWRDQAPSRRAIDNAVIVERIRRIHAESDATYGMPRARAELLDQGLRISGKRGATDADQRHPRRQPAAQLHRDDAARSAAASGTRLGQARVRRRRPEPTRAVATARSDRSRQHGSKGAITRCTARHRKASNTT